MTAKYTCPTCGCQSAVWHLRIDTSLLELCENCIQHFMKPNSHVIGFFLNKRVSRKELRR